MDFLFGKLLHHFLAEIEDGLHIGSFQCKFSNLGTLCGDNDTLLPKSYVSTGFCPQSRRSTGQNSDVSSLFSLPMGFEKHVRSEVHPAYDIKERLGSFHIINMQFQAVFDFWKY